MKRHITLHALLAGALLLPAVAQNDTPTAPPPPEASQGETAPPPRWNRGDRGERGERGPRRGRPRFNPDDPNFQENLKRWQEMSPEQRQEMRRRFDGRRQQMREEQEKILSELGPITEEQREAFLQRYREERRKIDEELRTKMEALRKEQIEALRKKLVEEFKAKPSS